MSLFRRPWIAIGDGCGVEDHTLTRDWWRGRAERPAYLDMVELMDVVDIYSRLSCVFLHLIILLSIRLLEVVIACSCGDWKSKEAKDAGNLNPGYWELCDRGCEHRVS